MRLFLLIRLSKINWNYNLFFFIWTDQDRIDIKKKVEELDELLDDYSTKKNVIYNTNGLL